MHPDFISAEARRQAVYRAKKSLPKSPKQYAYVTTKLIEKASPRKKHAIGILGYGNHDDKIRQIFTNGREHKFQSET